MNEDIVLRIPKLSATIDIEMPFPTPKTSHPHCTTSVGTAKKHLTSPNDGSTREASDSDFPILKTNLRPTKKPKLTFKLAHTKKLIPANSGVINREKSNFRRSTDSVRERIEELSEEYSELTKKAHWHSEALTDVLGIFNMQEGHDWDGVLEEITRLAQQAHRADSLEQETCTLRSQIAELTSERESNRRTIKQADETSKILKQRQIDISALQEEKKRSNKEREGDKAQLRDQSDKVKRIEHQIATLRDENVRLKRQHKEETGFRERVEELLKQRNKR